MLKEVKRVRNWWGTGLVWRLNIPYSKQTEMESDENGKEQAINYWLQKCPIPTWRKLIVALNKIGEDNITEEIQQYVEPLTGKTPYLVLVVFTGGCVQVVTLLGYTKCVICYHTITTEQQGCLLRTVGGKSSPIDVSTCRGQSHILERQYPSEGELSVHGLLPDVHTWETPVCVW